MNILLEGTKLSLTRRNARHIAELERQKARLVSLMEFAYERKSSNFSKLYQAVQTLNVEINLIKRKATVLGVTA